MGIRIKNQVESDSDYYVMRNISKAMIDELKYDLIINCPTCRGTGTAYYYFSKTEYKLSPYLYERIDRGLNVPEPGSYSGSSIIDINNWKFDGEYERECEEYENSWSESIHKKVRCEHCNGNGSAYAYFDNSKTCTKCNGKGTEVQKQKAEIGLENKVVKCSQCQGLKYQKEIFIKTHGNFSNRNLSYYNKLYANISASKDYAVISTVLDSEDKLKFYAKTKPRFKPGEKEKEFQKINELVKENERLERIRKEELEKERKIRKAREQKEREIKVKIAAENKRKAIKIFFFFGILIASLIFISNSLEDFRSEAPLADTMVVISDNLELSNIPSETNLNDGSVTEEDNLYEKRFENEILLLYENLSSSKLLNLYRKTDPNDVIYNPDNTKFINSSFRLTLTDTGVKNEGIYDLGEFYMPENLDMSCLPAIYYDAELEMLKVFFVEKNINQSDYGMDGIEVLIDINEDYFEKNYVFQSANWGWFPYYAVDNVVSNISLYHFSFAKYELLKSSMYDQETYQTLSTGPISPEEAENLREGKPLILIVQ